MSDSVKINIIPKNNAGVIHLEVENVASHCYKVARHAFAHGGVLANSDILAITEKEKDMPAEFTGRAYSVYPAYEKLEKGEKTSSVINLKDSFNLENGKVYAVCYSDSSVLAKQCHDNGEITELSISEDSIICNDIHM